MAYTEAKIVKGLNNLNQLKDCLIFELNTLQVEREELQQEIEENIDRKETYMQQKAFIQKKIMKVRNQYYLKAGIVCAVPLTAGVWALTFVLKKPINLSPTFTMALLIPTAISSSIQSAKEEQLNEYMVELEVCEEEIAACEDELKPKKQEYELYQMRISHLNSLLEHTKMQIYTRQRELDDGGIYGAPLDLRQTTPLKTIVLSRSTKKQ